MSNAGNQQWQTYYVPKNANLLKAIAVVTLRHNQLDHMLKYTMKSLAEVTIDVALDATQYAGSRDLRDRLKKLARQRLGEGAALIRFQALMERCARATLKRNDLVHSVWSKNAAGGKPRVSVGSVGARRPPSAKTLNALSDELYGLIVELNHARLHGFLHEAMKKKNAL